MPREALSSSKHEAKFMADPADLVEIDTRIALIRDNIRQLVEQAAALSGAADESLISNRISTQEEQLAALLKQREDLAR
jgi:hypothetical protein